MKTSRFAAVTAVISDAVSVTASLRVNSSPWFALIAARRLRSPSSRRMIVRYTAGIASATIAAEPSIEIAETKAAARNVRRLFFNFLPALLTPYFECNFIMDWLKAILYVILLLMRDTV